MVIDLGPAIASLSDDSLIVIVDRPNLTTWGVDGIADAQTFTSTPIENVSVQPISGRDLVKMPEGVRPSEVLTLYAPGFVLLEKDRVTVPGRGVFEVFNANGWGDPIGGYSKALARQLAQGEPRP